MWNYRTSSYAQALEQVNKSFRARNSKRLHLARVAKDVPAPVAEVSRGGQGQNARTTPGTIVAGRQPVGTDPRIDQLVSVQSDPVTQMQNMTAMMGRFVKSIIPASTRRIFPYPNRLSGRGSCTTPTLTMTIGATRATVWDATGRKTRLPAATATHAISQGTSQRNAPRNPRII